MIQIISKINIDTYAVDKYNPLKCKPLVHGVYALFAPQTCVVSREN